MFKDRQEAGYLLAKKLDKSDLVVNTDKTIVLGVARGGVVLARQIADFFKIDMDVLLVKKISAPNDPELAIGAIGETEGSVFIDKKMVESLQIKTSYLKKEIKQKLAKIKQREKTYRLGKKPIDLKGRDVIIADDGSATGATMIAAAREVWNNEPHRVILALPAVPTDTKHALEKEADGVVILHTPEPFFAVGQFYQNFEQLSDEQVISYLQK